MCSFYLVKFKPLEVYSFASETAYGGAFESKSNNQPTYILKSKEIPEQTTVFGTVRYLLLKATGLLCNDYNYRERNSENNNSEKGSCSLCDIIGNSSFSFKDKEQTFGMIKKVGPVFICDKDNNIVVQNPKCNKTKTGFLPFEMENIVCSSLGDNRHLPQKHDFLVKKEYDAKESWKMNGFIRLTNEGISEIKLKENEKLFTHTMMTGNAINKDTDGFFKYEVVSMAEGFSFATVIELKDDKIDRLKVTNNMIVYMGKRRAAFVATMEPITSNLYDDAFKNITKGYTKPDGALVWYYAASDVVLPEGYTYPDFSVVESKSIRNLTTNYDAKNQKSRLSRSDKQYNLIKAGSAFYGFNPNDAFETKDSTLLKHLQVIGLNKIVRIGEEING